MDEADVHRNPAYKKRSFLNLFYKPKTARKSSQNFQNDSENYLESDNQIDEDDAEENFESNNASEISDEENSQEIINSNLQSKSNSPFAP